MPRHRHSCAAPLEVGEAGERGDLLGGAVGLFLVHDVAALAAIGRPDIEVVAARVLEELAVDGATLVDAEVRKGLRVAHDLSGW